MSRFGRTSRAERRAIELLESQGIKGPPVPVERVATSLGARLAFEPFDGNISGMLHRLQGESSPVIGVNTSHAQTRQRFTIAHEIAHLLLHPGQEVILDRVVRVNYRDDRSGSATDAQEIEANRFAAEFLMPADWVRSELERLGASRRTLEAIVSALAGTFEVSTQAMDYRLTNLGIRQHL